MFIVTAPGVTRPPSLSPSNSIFPAPLNVWPRSPGPLVPRPAVFPAAAAYGGVRTKVYDNAIRVDIVQQSLMAVLDILEAFRLEDYRPCAMPEAACGVYFSAPARWYTRT